MQFRRTRLALTAVLAGSLLLVAPVADARPSAAVTIKLIPNAMTAPNGVAKIVPRYTKASNVVSSKALLTVRKSGTVVKKNVAYANLKPGSYGVTTTVKFKTRTTVQKSVTAQAGRIASEYDGYSASGQIFFDRCLLKSVEAPTPQEVPPGTGSTTYSRNAALTCSTRWINDTTNSNQSFATFTKNVTLDTVTSESGQQDFYFNVDFDRIYYYGDGFTDPSDTIGTQMEMYSVAFPYTITKSINFPSTSALKTISRKQSLTITKARTCATHADFQRVNVDFSNPDLYGDHRSVVAKKLHSYGKVTDVADYGDQVLETRTYKTCDRDASLTIIYENGYAYYKAYYS